MGFKFDWDPRKESANQQKHDVSFREAATVFNDLLSATFPDPDHSDNEERFITVGVSHRQRLLMVSHTEQNDFIRIISARQLTRRERKQYEESER